MEKMALMEKTDGRLKLYKVLSSAFDFFVLSLKGDKGLDGRDGKDGQMGLQGPRGPKGEKGLAGPQGEFAKETTYA